MLTWKKIWLFLSVFLLNLVEPENSIIINIHPEYLTTKSANFAKNFARNKFNLNFQHPLPAINICLGALNVQCVNLIIDTFSSTSWIINSKGNSDKHYSPEHSDTFKPLVISNLSFDYESFYVTGKPSSEQITVNDLHSSQNSTFYFLDVLSSRGGPLNVDGFIAFSKHLSNKYIQGESFSLLEILLRDGYINRKIFGLSADGAFRKFYIGEVPPKISLDSSPRCKSTFFPQQFQKNWLNYYHGCRLTSVKAKINQQDRVISAKIDGYFATGERYIILPGVMSNALEHIYAKANKVSSCSLEAKGNLNFILCDMFDVRTLGILYFQFEGVQMSIKPQDYFVVSEDFPGKVECLIVVNKKVDYALIGNPLLKNYHMLFDVDQNTSYFVEEGPSNKNKRKNIIAYFLSLNIFGVVFLILVYLHFRKGSLK